MNEKLRIFCSSIIGQTIDVGQGGMEQEGVTLAE